MKSFICVLFLMSTTLACGPKRDVVDFTTACVEAPNRKVAVEGLVQDGNPVCNSNYGQRNCSFWLKDPEGVEAILFTLTAGKQAHQVEISDADTSSKAEITVRGGDGNVLDLKKKIILSGTTTLLASSSMVPVCKLDDAEVWQ